MDRHLTVTGFVVHRGRLALHWHRKIQAWLPAGGHIEPNEDPVEAVLREIREEFAVEAEIVPLAPRVAYAGGPSQLEPPFTVLVCPVEPGHEHIDLVYFLRLTSGFPGRSHEPDSPIHWVDAITLRTEEGLTLAGECGPLMPFAPDVRALGLEAIRLVGEAERPLAGAASLSAFASPALDGRGARLRPEPVERGGRPRPPSNLQPPSSGSIP